MPGRANPRARRKLLDELRRESERRLVEQQHLRLGDQAARDGEHLLLAPGQESRALCLALAIAGSARASPHVIRRTRRRASRRPGARCRSPTSSGNTCRPSGTSTKPVRTRCDAPPSADLAAREQYLAFHGAQQPRQRAHQRRLARAVGAEHGNELAAMKPQVTLVQDGCGAIARRRAATERIASPAGCHGRARPARRTAAPPR